MTETDEEIDSRPLRDLHRLAGGQCYDCRTAYSGREAVGSMILGFKDAPRCLACLANGLHRDPSQLRAELVSHARRRECYRRAWVVAEGLDGRSTEWPALTESGEPTMPAARLANADEPNPEAMAEWDAGDMGCGELVLALRGRMNALPPGAVLKVTATDPAAPEDLPAWCRLTGHTLVRMNHPAYYIRRREG